MRWLIKNQKIRGKLILSYGFIALLTSLLITIASTIHFIRSYNNKISNLNMQILQQLNEIIENDFNYLKRLISYIALQSEVTSFLNKFGNANIDIREQLNAKYDVEEAMYFIVSNNNLVSVIELFPVASEIYISTEAPYLTHVFTSEERWYKDLMMNNSSYTYYFQHKDNKVFRYCIARKVYDLTNREVLGVVSINCDVKILETYVNKYDFGKRGILKIYNENDTIFVSNYDESSYGSAMKNYKAKKIGSYIDKICGEETLINAYYSDITGWTVFCKYFFPKVAKYFSIVLQQEFPQCCKPYFAKLLVHCRQ